ncbi:MAG: UbiX family flavin prenyltransferase [Eubacteriales bacterium]
MSRYIIAVTGASGSIYAQRLIETMLDKKFNIHLIVSKTGMKVIEHELECVYSHWINQYRGHEYFFESSVDDLFANVSSGSFKTDGMVVLPCSMGTVGRIAHGTSDNLIIRAADVCLKERRPLIACVRETPYNEIHLKNMLKINSAGGIILPLNPGFYHKPKTIDEIIDSQIGRVLDLLNIENDLMKRWGSDASH